MPTPTTGRASIFRGKGNGVRVQGLLTEKGGRALEKHRKELAAIVKEATGTRPTTVSDADVIEYLARGYMETWMQLHPGDKA